MTAERQARGALVVVWPQEGGRRIARVGRARGGEVGQQRQGLAAGNFDIDAVALKTRRAEEIELECGHGRLVNEPAR